MPNTADQSSWMPTNKVIVLVASFTAIYGTLSVVDIGGLPEWGRAAIALVLAVVGAWVIRDKPNVPKP